MVIYLQIPIMTVMVPVVLKIQAWGEILLSTIHKLINSIWNKEELPDQWKESIIVPVNKKGDKTDRNNYREISLITSYKIVSNILLSRLAPYIDELNGEHQCGFRRNRSTTDQMFCIRQILSMRQYIRYSYTSISRKPMKIAQKLTPMLVGSWFIDNRRGN
jgi:hypothetical protein